MGCLVPEKLDEAEASLLPLLVTEPVEFGPHLENAVLALFACESDDDGKDDGLILIVLNNITGRLASGSV